MAMPSTSHAGRRSLVDAPAPARSAQTRLGVMPRLAHRSASSLLKLLRITASGMAVFW